MGRQSSKINTNCPQWILSKDYLSSEQVYLTLKTAILTGELMPQEKLNEVKIAEQLQVSATPVREAFRKLAKDNLVVNRSLERRYCKADTPEEIVAHFTKFVKQWKDLVLGLCLVMLHLSNTRAKNPL